MTWSAPRLDEVVEHAMLGLDDHQMDVERLVASRAARPRPPPGPSVMLGTKRPSMTSTWIQSAPASSTAAHLLAEAAEIGGQDRGRDQQRLHGAPPGRGLAAAGSVSTRLGEALVVVGGGRRRSPALFTSSLALPMAMLNPLFLNISTSFGMSPIVANSSARDVRGAWTACSTTEPLLASGMGDVEVIGLRAGRRHLVAERRLGVLLGLGHEVAVVADRRRS